jgi:hypothetical protein
VYYTKVIKANWALTDLPQRWRWHPLDSNWYSYPEPGFSLDDVGLANSPAASGFGLFGQVPTFFDAELVGVFNSSKAAYAAVSQRYPHAVWDPRDGSWRSPLRIQSAPPPIARTPLPPDAVARIAEVHQLVADRTITPEEGERRIDEIVTEYT